MNNAKRAVLNTIIYSDLFNFPLNKKELWYLLKSNVVISKKDFLSAVIKLKQEIILHNNYYCLAFKKNIITRRINKLEVNINKTELAKKAAKILSVIPSVYFIGLSGSVAQGNANTSDDIDFFIITKKNTIWYSRFTILLILHFLNIRRTRNTANENNKVCVNMLIDENSLSFNSERRDIYTAHEIAQLKPLVNKHKTYQRFIKANSWINDFMPNVLTTIKSELQYKKESISEGKSILKRMFSFIISLFENILIERILKIIQKHIIYKHLTTETISDRILAFHPYDYREKVLLKYKKKLQLYKLN